MYCTQLVQQERWAQFAVSQAMTLRRRAEKWFIQTADPGDLSADAHTITHVPRSRRSAAVGPPMRHSVDVDSHPVDVLGNSGVHARKRRQGALDTPGYQAYENHSVVLLYGQRSSGVSLLKISVVM